MFTAILLVAGCALLGLGLVGTVMLWWASGHAPEGHEDKHGFHPASSDYPGGPPSSPPAPTGDVVTDGASRLAPMR